MSKYPSTAQIAAWFAEGPEGCDIAEFIARKACDWRREQDALTCDRIATQYTGAYVVLGLIADKCAKVIRDTAEGA